MDLFFCLLSVVCVVVLLCLESVYFAGVCYWLCAFGLFLFCCGVLYVGRVCACVCCLFKHVLCVCLRAFVWYMFVRVCCVVVVLLCVLFVCACA